MARWRVSLLTPALLLLAATWPSGAGRTFHDDDPLTRERDTEDASGVQARSINLAWDELRNTFGRAGDPAATRALNVNTVDDVPNSSWFTHRVGTVPLTAADVARGSDTTEGPVPGRWTVVSAKADGVTPGFTIRDTAGVTWFIKFDPPGHPELATGAEVVATTLFWALGYHVPENHIASLRPEHLELADALQLALGPRRTRRMTIGDIHRLLRRAARNADGTYRVLASRALEGTPLGGFLYQGTRPDDPNDVVPHEHRRELRALRVFGAWLNHVDAKAINTLDTLIEGEGQAFVRHHLIDFGSTLGSAALKPREYDEGHEYVFEGRKLAQRLMPPGLPIPSWRRITYPRFRAIGNIEADHFDPATWKTRVPNPAHRQMRVDDAFWAARKVMAISDQMIDAAVARARYSDPTAAAYLTRTLARRRDRIGARYLPLLNPVVDPAFDGTTLTFVNAAVEADVASAPRAYATDWYAFDNDTGKSSLIASAVTGRAGQVHAPAGVPRGTGTFVRVDIAAVDPPVAAWRAPVRVYFRSGGAMWTLAGLERLAEQRP